MTSLPLSAPNSTTADAPRMSRSLSQTMSRGIRIMEVLAESGAAMSAQDLAETLRLDRAVVYRLLRTLSAHRLVTPGLEGGYMLGVGLLALSRGVQGHLRNVAFPYLVTLAAETSATAYIGVREGDEVVCVATVEPTHSLVAVRFREGLRRPMSRGASAFAIRSRLPALDDDPAELVEARANGYAFSMGTIETGASAVACALLLPEGTGQACVTAIFPTDGSRDIPAIAAHVTRAAAAISDAARRS
jgi:DNA-binding IclR family transcriptional regulator